VSHTYPQSVADRLASDRCGGEETHVREFLEGEFEVNRPLARLRRKFQDNIEINLKGNRMK
jgi:hypothetical protein